MQQNLHSPPTTKKDSCFSEEEAAICKDLRVSCSLETSTTVSSDGFITTPRSDAGTPNSSSSDNDEKWKTFYKRVGKTPPKATLTTPFDETIEKANKLLELSDEFKDKPFESLTEDQQAILVFMFVKNMHTEFGGGSLLSAVKVLIPALNPESPEYKRMMSFVRLGGDRVCPIPSIMERSYSIFINKNPEWKSERVTTIFVANPEMEPFFHIQTEESYLCTFAACASLLYYCSYKQEHHTKETIKKFKMNVSRYVRDEISGRKIANFTLTAVKGAHLDEVLLSLLQSFGTLGDSKDLLGDSKKVELERVRTFEGNEKGTCSVLECYLQEGCPIVFEMECLPSLSDSNRHEYTGKVFGHHERAKEARADQPPQRKYHALLCIGIEPRNGSRPPMLLVQDSCPARPLFSVGLDLLMDIGLDTLQFCTVPKQWKFNQNKDYIMNPETRPLVCGSPMAVDDNGVPHVVFPEAPVRERRDMSRYCEFFEVKEGVPLCYEI